MVCSSCGSNQAMYCAKCFHSSSGRTAGNTVGTQPTDVQQLKAEIARILFVFSNECISGGEVALSNMLKSFGQLSAI